jgi:Rod binding domain-containing protein
MSVIPGITATATLAATPREQARAAAEEFVSVALVQPLLMQLRASNSAAPPFAPTQGEKQFQSLLDAELARQITRSSRFAIVDRLATDLLTRGVGAGKAGRESEPVTDPAAEARWLNGLKARAMPSTAPVN